MGRAYHEYHEFLPTPIKMTSRYCWVFFLFKSQDITLIFCLQIVTERYLNFKGYLRALRHGIGSAISSLSRPLSKPNSWHSVNWITELLINILKNICYRQNKTIQGKTTKCIFHYNSLFIKMFLLKIRLWKRKAIIIVTPLFPLQTRNKVSYSQSLHLSLSSCNILFGANVP